MNFVPIFIPIIHGSYYGCGEISWKDLPTILFLIIFITIFLIWVVTIILNWLIPMEGNPSLLEVIKENLKWIKSKRIFK